VLSYLEQQSHLNVVLLATSYDARLLLSSLSSFFVSTFLVNLNACEMLVVSDGFDLTLKTVCPL